jgi:hypothetical protein
MLSQMLAWVVLSSVVLADLDIKVEAGAEEIMDGGYRGQIHLVPQLPEGKYKRHLTWTTSAFADIDAFFTAMKLPDPAPRRATAPRC